MSQKYPWVQDKEPSRRPRVYFTMFLALLGIGTLKQIIGQLTSLLVPGPDYGEEIGIYIQSLRIDRESSAKHDLILG